MTALLIKDFLNMKEQLKFYVILLGIYGLISGVTESTGAFSGILLMLIVIMVINTFSYDERAKWDKFCLCTPISRKNVVMEKYVLGLIMFVICGVISVVFLLVVEDSFSLGKAVIYTLSIEGATMIMMSVILPVVFKLGVEKGRIVMMMVMVLPLLLIFSTPFMSQMFGDSLVLPDLSQMQEESVLAIIGTLIGLGYIVSGFVSYKVYREREF